MELGQSYRILWRMAQKDRYLSIPNLKWNREALCPNWEGSSIDSVWSKKVSTSTFSDASLHWWLIRSLCCPSGYPPLAAARMQRWALILAIYQYDIQYKSSERHGNCDSLSRLPLPDGSEEEETFEWVFCLDLGLPVSSQEIATATKEDSILSRVFDFTLNGWPAHVTDTDLQPFFDRRN